MLILATLLGTAAIGNFGNLLFSPEERTSAERNASNPVVNGLLSRNGYVLTLWINGKAVRPDNGQIPPEIIKENPAMMEDKNTISTQTLSKEFTPFEKTRRVSDTK